MKALLWIVGIASVLLALVGIPWAIGVNVAINGQPTAWGSCK